MRRLSSLRSRVTGSWKDKVREMANLWSRLLNSSSRRGDLVPGTSPLTCFWVAEASDFISRCTVTPNSIQGTKWSLTHREELAGVRAHAALCHAWSYPKGTVPSLWEAFGKTTAIPKVQTRRGPLHLLYACLLYACFYQQREECVGSARHITELYFFLFSFQGKNKEQSKEKEKEKETKEPKERWKEVNRHQLVPGVFSSCTSCSLCAKPLMNKSGLQCLSEYGCRCLALALPGCPRSPACPLPRPAIPLLKLASWIASLLCLA